MARAGLLQLHDPAVARPRRRPVREPSAARAARVPVALEGRRDEPGGELRGPAGPGRLLMNVAYEKGLHELGDGLYAYLQPDGGWGWSNAGLISADGTSLLVDTLYDLHCARDMLDSMRAITDRSPIGAAMNTHGNGDHCFGNQLVPASAPIYATAAAAEEMQAAPPELLHA